MMLRIAGAAAATGAGAVAGAVRVFTRFGRSAAKTPASPAHRIVIAIRSVVMIFIIHLTGMGV
jgi:hypothetical protein